MKCLTLCPRGPAQGVEGQVKTGQKRPERAQFLALDCVSKFKPLPHHWIPTFSSHRCLPGKPPVLQLVPTRVQGHEEKEQAQPRSKNQGMEAETAMSSPGYRPVYPTEPHALIWVTIWGGDRLQPLREESASSGLVFLLLHLLTR